MYKRQVLPIRDQNFAAFRLDYYPSRVDSRLGDSPRELMADNLFECKNYARNFSAHAPNLLFYGSTGLGKTFLSTCIAAVVSERGFSVAYDTVSYTHLKACLSVPRSVCRKSFRAVGAHSNRKQRWNRCFHKIRGRVPRILYKPLSSVSIGRAQTAEYSIGP